jgi:tetratricopeptide (TPR) repeat protein
VWVNADALQRWIERGETLPDSVGSNGAVLVAQSDHAVYSNDAAAEDLLLRARFSANCRTPQGLETAMGLYAKLAVARPEDTVALNGIAECYLLAREFGTIPDALAYAKAAEFSTRALAKNPRSADATRILGFVDFWSCGESELGLMRLRRAAEMGPANVRARHWLGTALAASGACAEALAELEMARRIEPNSVAVLADRAMVQFAGGERERARSGLEELTRAAPAFSAAHAYLAAFALVEDRDCDLPGHLEHEAKLRGDKDGLDGARQVQAALKAGGTTAMRRAYAMQQETRHEAGDVSAFSVAQAWAAAGQADRALGWLTRCRTNREPGLAAVRGNFLLNHFLGRHGGFAAFSAA